jgi:hypothetical protein
VAEETSDTRDARPSGTGWFVTGLISMALLVTGFASYVMATVFALSVFMYIRVRGRDAVDVPRPTGTLWFVITLIVAALLVTGAFDPPWIGAAALASCVLLYIRARMRSTARPGSTPPPHD